MILEPALAMHVHSWHNAADLSVTSLGGTATVHTKDTLNHMANELDRQRELSAPSLRARRTTGQSPKRPPAFLKDEVKRAIELRGNCRIPQLFQPVPLFFRNESLYEFFETWPCDLIPVGNSTDASLDLRRVSKLISDGVTVLHGSSAVKHVLRDWSQVDAVYDLLLAQPTSEWKEAIQSQIAQTPDLYHVAMHIGLLFEPIYLLRGMEQFFLDLYDHRTEVDRLLDRLLEFNIKAARAYADAGVDGIFTSDDWGTQRSLMIDPVLWRAMFKPRYAAFVDAAHKAGVHVIFHSDGNLDSIFPDLVETGIDVANPLQPGALDVDRWVKEYRAKVAFWTGVDVQGMLPFVSPQKVKDEVRRSIDKFRHDKGGLIIGPTNAITAEVPYENLVALHETLLEYR
jgi:hypothetical protein